MKFLIAAMGPGEVSQGFAFAQYVLQHNNEVLFALTNKENIEFIPTTLSGLTLQYVPDLQSLINLVNVTKPDSLLLCNSKLFHTDPNFLNNSPFGNVPTFTLDSNWLFDTQNRYYSPIRWARRYYINIPKHVFDQGLVQNGGHFSIGSEYKERITPVGLIPSYHKISSQQKKNVRSRLGLTTADKYIFCYLSGWGSSAKNWILERLFESVNELRNEMNTSIRVYWSGKVHATSQSKSESWFLPVPHHKIDANTFFNYMASADLVFQHQGLGTLEQAISAEVPAIANVKLKTDIPKLHIYEIEPFAKLNLCSMLTQDDSNETVKKNVKALLFDSIQIERMKSAQREIYEEGEKKMYQFIVCELTRQLS